jgi:hypothetical protein
MLVLFGEGEGGWLAKLDFIDKRLMDGKFDWPIHGLFWPLFIACLWVFVFPFVARKVLVFSKSQLLVTKRAVLEAEKNSPLSESEATRLRLRTKNLSDKWDIERKLYLQTIESLQDNRAQKSSATPITTGEVGGALEEQGDYKGTVVNKIGFEIPEPQATELKHAMDDASQESESGVLSGLNLEDSSVSDRKSNFHIEFKGRSVAWPWRFRSSEQTNLSSVLVKSLQNFVFGEQALLVLFVSRNSNRVNSGSLANVLMLDRFIVQVALDELLSVGLVSGPYQGTDYEVNSAGRLFLAWLMRKGFEFRGPDTSS